jgi:hypothetical protein
VALLSLTFLRILDVIKVTGLDTNLMFLSSIRSDFVFFFFFFSVGKLLYGDLYNFSSLFWANQPAVVFVA